MSASKGFTLIELIVTMVIVGVLATIAIPTYENSLQQQAALAAQNNLIAIYNGEKSYYLGPTGSGTYCINSGVNPACGGTTAELNGSLGLNIVDNNFYYQCATDASGFSCTAFNNTDIHFKLVVTNTPLVLPGSAAAHNPSCTHPANPNSCP